MSDDLARQLLQQIPMLETHLADLQRREATMMSALQETYAAIESLKSLKEKPESEALMSVGMGAHIQCKISSNTKVFLTVGAGVVIEKNSDSAINFLEMRAKKIQLEIQNTFAQKQNVVAKLEQTNAQMNQLMQATGQKLGPGNV